MLKKNLIILFVVFCFLCISNVCFATNTGDNIKNTLNSATNTIVDGVSNLATDVRNGIGDAENGIEDALTMNTMDNNTDAGNTNTENATEGYTATRTATTRDAMGATGADTTTMWVWVIFAIAAVVIVGLVWYYGSQNRVD